MAGTSGRCHFKEEPEKQILANECLDGVLCPFGVGAGGDDRDGGNEMSIVTEEMSEWAHLFFLFFSLVASIVASLMWKVEVEFKVVVEHSRVLQLQAA